MQTYKVTVDKDKTIRWSNDKDERHRLDGPAVEWLDDYKEWWVNGKLMTEKEFNKYTKPKPTCEGKVVEVDGKKYKLVSI